MEKAAKVVKTHMEVGWDQEYGGLFLAIDAGQVNGERKSESIDWGFPDSKLWWPHTEALYALLLSYEVTKDDSFMEWFKMVDKYAF